jgi:hypothetical protein
MGKPLPSWDAARREIGTIVARVNADPALALAAAANPLFALEAIGYTIEPAVRREFEERIRFSPEQVARLHHLNEQIDGLAGRHVDPASAADVHRLLFDELHVHDKHAKHERHEKHEKPAVEALERTPQLGWTAKAADPLEHLRERHRIVELVLEYRALEASEPRLATREFFDQVRSGKAHVRANKITFRLRNQGPAPA